jgi:multicomponent K+:H+ antiporter subunit F
MIPIALTFAMACFGIGLLLTMARLLFAPTVSDRILALDAMVINVIALIVLYGIRFGAAQVFEVALLIAMTGFVATVALCKYLLRGNIIE